MKIHKNNVKLYFKNKNTITALCLLLVFIIVFCITFTSFATSIKGVAEMFSSAKIEQIYDNNYSTIYAVDEKNRLYYSYNKNSPGHLNNYADISSLENEYGDATSHFYNFIMIDYKFSGDIIKVDGYRDNAFGLNGYTLVLTEFNDLYILYNNSKTFTLLTTNVIDFDAGYENFTVLTKDHQVYEYIQKGAYFYRIDTQMFDIEKIATQGHKIVNNQYQFISYYIDKNQTITENRILIDYNNLHNYEQIDINGTIKEIKDNTIITQQELSIDNSKHEIKQICSIENATLILTNDNLIYGIGDNFIEDDYGIFGTGEENRNQQYVQFEKINVAVKNIESIYTTGTFALVIKTKNNEFYYSGNIGYEMSSTFTKINQYGTFDQINGGYYSTIVIKNGIVYYIDYKDNNNLVRMYDNFIVQTLMKYISLFLIVMTVLYLIIYFFEENSKYNRYFKRRYQDEENNQKN